MFENTLNPHDWSNLAAYWDVARQTYWHVFVIGEENEELNWFELENRFDLDIALKVLIETAAYRPCIDFNLANSEFEARFSMQDLLRFDINNR